MIKLEIDLRVLRRLTLIVGVLNTLLIGAFALIQAGRLGPGLVPVYELDPALQFDMQREGGTLAVWYSSLLFLLVAAIALMAYAFDRQRRRDVGGRAIVGRGWLILAMGAIFLSLDESAQIHEGVGYLAGIFGALRIEGLTDVSAQFVWVLVLAPLFLGAAALLLAFFLVWLAPVRRAQVLSIVGMTCWMMVPLLEFVESRLARTFGDLGVAPEQLLEESLELVGAAALIAAGSEYVIGQWAKAAGEPSAKAQYGGIPAGAWVALPLLLIPLAGLAFVVDDDLGRWFADRGYAYSAYRVEMVMFNLDPQGNFVLLSDACDLDPFARNLPYDVERAGPLVNYPPPAHRTTSPPLTLTALLLTEGVAGERVEESLQRLTLLSTHVWHLRCGAGSAVDDVVAVWLGQHATPQEDMWLPGLPPVRLTRATPLLPPQAVPTAEPVLVDVLFGDDEVALDGTRISLENDGAAEVLRLVLQWRAAVQVTSDYHVFVHLVDAAGDLVAQTDGAPLYDGYPFSQWVPGESVIDFYDLPVPQGARLEEMDVRIGLYDYITGERLLLSGSGLDYISVALPPATPS